jgi:hypothetical protein
MMVVSDPALEPGWMPSRLDPPQQARRGTRRQHVVNGLGRYCAELFPQARPDRLGGGVRMRLQPGEHDQAWHRHAQPGRAQRPRQHAIWIDRCNSHDIPRLPRLVE